MEWNTIEFGRTDKGKPYLISPGNATFGINVSHQGDYVAFASSCSSRVSNTSGFLNLQENEISSSLADCC